MQVALGYSLTGLIDEHVFFILYGPQGRNGKGVLVDTVRAIMGDYAIPTNFEVYLASDKVGNVNVARAMEEIGSLRASDLLWPRKRTGTGSSRKRRSRTSPGAMLGRVPACTASSTTGRAIGQAVVPYQPFASHPDASDGMWDRVRVFPFYKRFREDEQDHELRRTLQAEAEGIFAWIVDGGADKYLTDGKLPQLPQKMEEARTQYRTQRHFRRVHCGSDGAWAWPEGRGWCRL